MNRLRRILKQRGNRIDTILRRNTDFAVDYSDFSLVGNYTSVVFLMTISRFQRECALSMSGRSINGILSYRHHGLVGIHRCVKSKNNLIICIVGKDNGKLTESVKRVGFLIVNILNGTEIYGLRLAHRGKVRILRHDIFLNSSTGNNLKPSGSRKEFGISRNSKNNLTISRSRLSLNNCYPIL